MKSLAKLFLPMSQRRKKRKFHGNRYTNRQTVDDKESGPVHMAVGDPGKVRYPTYPWSRKAGLHMQPRGAGVTKVLSYIPDFFFHPVITFPKNLFFVQPLLIVLIFLTDHFFQSFFRLSGAFRPEFIIEINRQAWGITVYMAERSCSKSFPLKSQVILYSLRYLRRSSTRSGAHALTFGVFFFFA